MSILLGPSTIPSLVVWIPFSGKMPEWYIYLFYLPNVTHFSFISDYNFFFWRKRASCLPLGQELQHVYSIRHTFKTFYVSIFPQRHSNQTKCFRLQIKRLKINFIQSIWHGLFPPALYFLFLSSQQVENDSEMNEKWEPFSSKIGIPFRHLMNPPNLSASCRFSAERSSY